MCAQDLEDCIVLVLYLQMLYPCQQMKHKTLRKVMDDHGMTSCGDLDIAFLLIMN
jgi:hypothetical protein